MEDETWERKKIQLAQQMREQGYSPEAIAEHLTLIDEQRSEQALSSSAERVLEACIGSVPVLLGPDGKPIRG